jgi:hypothetical protein
MTKLTMTSKCSSIAAHYKGLADAPEQYRWHCPMRHDQGYPGSHWTPPLSNYLLCIAPLAARASANKTTKKKWTNFAGHFNGRGGAPVQYRTHCPIEEVQGCGRSHWTPPWGKYCGQYMQLVLHMQVFFIFIIVNSLKKVVG